MVYQELKITKSQSLIGRALEWSTSWVHVEKNKREHKQGGIRSEHHKVA